MNNLNACRRILLAIPLYPIQTGLFWKLMLPTHESKTTGHKFDGRKEVGDEVLELPIGIMQDNTQVSWLATRGLSPLPQGPWEQTQQHALYWVLMPRAIGNKQINISWFRGYAGVLIPRAFGNKQNNIPWFRGYAGVLIPRAFGNKEINIPWFRGYAGVLIPRAFGNKQNNIPWFRGCAGVLIPRAFGNKHNNVPWFPGYAGL